MSTPFEQFVNSELPVRLSVSAMPASFNLNPNKIMKTTGIGLNMTESDISEGNMPLKTGWDISPGPGVTISFTDATRTFTVTDGGSAYYYILGEKYILGGNKTVQIDDTEGEWFIYFDEANLSASQTPWIIHDDDKALVAFLYWDSTNKKSILTGYELHSWVMDSATHSRLHWGGGAAWESGFQVSEVTSEQVNVSPGSFYDEDINVTVTDSAGTGLFQQELSPAQLPIYYVSGTSDWRIFEVASKTNVADVGYVLATNLKYNLNTAGTWSVANVDSAKFTVMYVVATNGISRPVAMIMGQKQYNTLALAKSGEAFSSLNLVGFPAQELITVARIIIKESGSAPYYTIEEITDLRSYNGEGNVTSPLVADHGALNGLDDDDHSGYLLLAGRGGQTITDTLDIIYNGEIVNADMGIGVEQYFYKATTEDSGLDGIGGLFNNGGALSLKLLDPDFGLVALRVLIETDGGYFMRNNYLFGSYTRKITGAGMELHRTTTDTGPQLVLVDNGGLHYASLNCTSAGGLIATMTNPAFGLVSTASNGSPEIGFYQGSVAAGTYRGHVRWTDSGDTLDITNNDGNILLRPGSAGTSVNMFSLSPTVMTLACNDPKIIFNDTGTDQYDGAIQVISNSMLFLGNSQTGAPTTTYMSIGLSSGAINVVNSLAVGKSSAAVACAKLEIDGTNGGLLLPRVTTTQRNAITTPVEGLVVYNTTTDLLNVYDGTDWSAPVKEVAISAYEPTIYGETAVLTDDFTWKKIGNTVWVWFDLRVTSDGTDGGFTLPVTAKVTGGSGNNYFAYRYYDGSSFAVKTGWFTTNTEVIFTDHPTNGVTAWWQGSFCYEAA